LKRHAANIAYCGQSGHYKQDAFLRLEQTFVFQTSCIPCPARRICVFVMQHNTKTHIPEFEAKSIRYEKENNLVLKQFYFANILIISFL